MSLKRWISTLMLLVALANVFTGSFGEVHADAPIAPTPQQLVLDVAATPDASVHATPSFHQHDDPYGSHESGQSDHGDQCCTHTCHLAHCNCVMLKGAVLTPPVGSSSWSAFAQVGLPTISLDSPARPPSA